jgi:hypothetical protein
MFCREALDEIIFEILKKARKLRKGKRSMWSLSGNFPEVCGTPYEY